ncbi:MAG: response regulator [Chloroflexi bacterium]|nr:response regulator [Chloroflexota bacterium]
MSKILVADDEPDMRSLLSDLLEEAGHVVTEAENGQMAYHQIQREAPDVVLMDVLMPMMNGIQVLQRLRNEPGTLNLPVILLTAFSLADEESEILESPNTYHVTKPWRRGVVESAVNTALARD